MKKSKIVVYEWNAHGVSIMEFVGEFYKAFGLKCDIKINGTKGYIHNFTVGCECCCPVTVRDFNVTYYCIPELGYLGVKGEQDLPF